MPRAAKPKPKKEAKAKSEAGRPTDYRPEYAKQAEKLCRLGATIYDLADFFEKSSRTIDRWIARHDDFCRAVKVNYRQLKQAASETS